MLSNVRSALKGPVTFVIVVLLIMAFALWGVPELQQMTRGAAMTVGDKTYSAPFLQREYNRALDQRRREMNNKYSQADAIAEGFPDQVMSSFATISAIEQYADRIRLSVPREIVRDFLQNNENFQNPATGKFDRTVLDSILRNNNLTVTEFENEIAKSMVRDQLARSLGGIGRAPEPMARDLLLRQSERRRIVYLLVTKEMAGAAAEPSPEDLQNYYDENPAAFTSPEYRNFDVLEIKTEDFKDALEAPEEELRRRYELLKASRYETPEKRSFHQLLFQVEEVAKAAAGALRAGTPFETIAENEGKSLEDTTLFEIEKSAMIDPAVAEAAFKNGLATGAIIGPVKNAFGWTVLQLTDVVPGETRPFEEVKDEIRAEYLESDARRALLDKIDEIEEARDTGASLAEAAENAGLEVTSIGPVDRFSFTPGGAIAPNVTGEALSEAFRLEEGDQSEALQLNSGEGYYFVAVKEVIAPTLKPFEDVRDEVEQKWRNEERKNRIAKTVANIRKTAQESGLAAAAAPYNRTPTELLLDRRFENETISSAFTEQIFFAGKGDIVSAPAPFGEAQVIARITDIAYNPAQLSPQNRDMFAQYLGYQLDGEMVEAFITEIRDDYGVEIDRSQLSSIYGDGQ